MGCNSDTIQSFPRIKKETFLNFFYKVTITLISKPDQVQKRKLNRNLTCIKAVSINILAENIHQYFLKIHYEEET